MSNAETPDEEIKELYAYGAGLQSLSEIVGLDGFVKLEFLSLHGNHIERIQGLERLPLLKELNLSSNNIREMEGLTHLSELQVLNLSCNRIEEIKDVQGLRALRKLLLAHNRISCLGGLSSLHGLGYSLQFLDMRDNVVSSLAELKVLAGCVKLTELIFSWGNHHNPVCQALAYKSAVVAAVPHILRLDGKTLYPGSGPSCTSQAPSLIEGNFQFRDGGFLSSSRALQYKNDSLQALPFDTEPSQPWQAFLQPQQELPISAKQNNTPSWVHETSSSDLLSMASLSHPRTNQKLGSPLGPGKGPGLGVSANNSSAGLRLIRKPLTFFDTGRNPCPKTGQRGLSVPDANHSNQTNHEARLGVLEEKILNLVQQLPNVETDPQGEVTGQHGIRAVSWGGSEVSRRDWRDILKHRKRKENVSDAELNDLKAPSSGGDSSDSCKSGMANLGRPLPSNVDSGSESSECETPARRWVHFGDKRKEKKDLARLGRNSDKAIPVPANNQILEQLYKEVRGLQAGLASLTSIHGGVQVPEKKSEEQSKRTTESKQNEKEAALCKLTRDCTLLESKLATSEEKFSEERNNILGKLESEQEERKRLQEILRSEQEERNKLLENLKAEQEERNKLRARRKAEQEATSDLQKTLEAAESKICRLERTLQDNSVKEQEMSKKVEKFAAERAQIESFLHDKYRGKFLSQNTELISLKEALNVAIQARQNAESALLDATAEKESSRQLAVSLGQLLEEEKGKLGVCDSDLDCRSLVLELREQAEKSSKDLLDAKAEYQEALAQLSKLHKQEMQEAVMHESAAGESRGMRAAEKKFDSKFDQLRNTMGLKLRDAQKELEEALEEVGKLRQDMCSLRNEKEREESTLKETIRRVLLKEQDKEALVVELSSVVRSQKIKLQTAQFDLEGLAEAEEDLQKMHQEMAVVRRKADKCDELTYGVECLQQKLAEVTADAQRQKESITQNFRTQLASLQTENKRLTADLQKLNEFEDAVKVKNKMLDCQNETIKELKLEASQATEACKDALKSSQVLQTEWTSRLQIEINQREALQNNLAKQGVTITGLEEKLRFERAAKMAAEKASKALRDQLKEKEGMFSYVEEEILQVKELYDSKLKDVGVERDQALEELKLLHQEKEKLEALLADAQRRREELLEADRNREEVLKAEAIDKNLQLSQAFQRVVEVEGKLQSERLAMESQKHVLVLKLDQLHKLLEELREGN